MRYLACFVLLAFAAQPLAAQQRTLFDFGHLDIDWTYSAGEWSVRLVWDEVSPALNLDLAAGVLVAKDEPYVNGEGSRVTRPGGAEWDFLGISAGEEFWVLPASAFDNPILEPGFATYGVPSDGPDEVRINLVDVVYFGEGEAHFSTYTTNNQVHMTTSNGIGADDRYVMGRGDHRHLNWAFTAKGVYQVTFTASMLQVANDEDSRTTSDPQTLTFAIGLPAMGLWLLQQGVEPGDLGAADSPAGDGVPNLLKYALGLPPLVPVAGPLVVPAFFAAGGEEFLAIDLPLNPQAQGIDVRVETSADLATWLSGDGHTVTLDHTAERIHVRDALAAGDAARRFIRLAVEIDGGE